MKKCLIFFVILVAVLAFSILADQKDGETPNKTLVINNIGVENLALEDQHGD